MRYCQVVDRDYSKLDEVLKVHKNAIELFYKGESRWLLIRLMKCL